VLDSEEPSNQASGFCEECIMDEVESRYPLISINFKSEVVMFNEYVGVEEGSIFTLSTKLLLERLASLFK
jgi:hypothetical protein